MLLQDQKALIADQLSNNEVSSDEEMIEFICEETKLPREIVTAIVTEERPKHFTNPFYQVDWNIWDKSQPAVYQLNKEEFTTKYETMSYGAGIAAGLFSNAEDNDPVTEQGDAQNIEEIYAFDQDWIIAKLTNGKYLIGYGEEARHFTNFDDAVADLWKLYDYHAPYAA